MENKSKKRGRNFNEFEKSLIVDLVKDSQHIVENKKTDAVTVQEKEAVWRKIAAVYNPVSQTGERTALQLHSLYLTLKKKAKKDSASDRAEIYKTGGGMYTPALDSTGDKIISMIGNQFIPLSNPYDSSAALYEDIPEDVVSEVSYKDSTPIESIDDIPHQPQSKKMVTPQEKLSSDAGHIQVRSTPERKRRNYANSSLRELTEHIGQRKRFKNDFDQEFHNKRMEILEIELQIKRKQLEQAEHQCECSRIDLEIKKKLLESNDEKINSKKPN